MSLVGFTLLGTIEVPSITGSATAVPLLVKPNTEFTAAMLASLDAGGGDLRFGTEDGTTQYPCEIVDGLNTVWMTPTGLSVASAATVGVWGDNTGASQPAVGAAYGRNAVWADYTAVVHGQVDFEDSTGNYTPTIVGSPTTSADGVSISPNNYVSYAGSTLEPSLSVIADVNIVTLGSNLFDAYSGATIFSARGGANDVSPTLYYNRGTSFKGHGFVADTNATARGAADGNTTNNVPYAYTAKGTFDADDGIASYGGTWRSFVNGVKTAENSGATAGTYDSSKPWNTAGFWIGYHQEWNNSPTITIKDLFVKKFADTEAYTTIEQSNREATTAWWIAADAGGGADIISPTTIATLESFGTSVITTGLITLSPIAIATAEVFGTPIISSGATILTPLTIASLEFVGTPLVLPLGVALQPVVIPTGELVGTPTVVTGLVFVVPDSIPTEEFVGSPVIDLILKQIFPTSILTLEDVGRPIVLGGDSIVIPISSRQTWNAVAQYLRDLVFTGQDNDVIMKWLRSEGFEDAYNDNWENYLFSEGYLTGAQSDKYAAWRRGEAGITDPWLLTSGSWDDTRVWVDIETWRDS